MGKRPSEVGRLAERVQALIAQGVDVVEAYAASRPGSADRELVRYQKRQAELADRHRKAVESHVRSVRAQRRGTVTYAATAVGVGALGVVDAASGGAADASWLPGSPWMYFAGAVLAAVWAVRSRWEADHAQPPQPLDPYAAAGEAPVLRRDAVGWAQAEGLRAVRRQVQGMVPAVTALHADAGRELAEADGEAGPLLGAQVVRLALLDQVARELPGTPAADTATRSATQVAAALTDGVEHYDRLLSAAATMLAAPDLGRGTAQVLGPAADALTAYAHGLRTAADGA